MPTAISASRPSSTTGSGVPEVNPSTEVHGIWSVRRGLGLPRSRSGEARAEPAGVPDVGPPTSFETQVSVT